MPTSEQLDLFATGTTDDFVGPVSALVPTLDKRPADTVEQVDVPGLPVSGVCITHTCCGVRLEMPWGSMTTAPTLLEALVLLDWNSKYRLATLPLEGLVGGVRLFRRH